MEITKATFGDLKQAVACLVGSFASDPQMACFFPVNSEKRPEIVCEFFTILMEARLALQMPVLLAKRGDQVHGAVMGYDSTRPDWLPLHAQNFSEFEDKHSGLAERLAAADDVMKNYEPDNPHYYLGVLGVSPSTQGKGLGSALINKFLQLSDEDEASNGTFLETANPMNISFYQRLGFRVLGNGPLNQTTTLWCLYRPKP